MVFMAKNVEVQSGVEGKKGEVAGRGFAQKSE